MTMHGVDSAIETAYRELKLIGSATPVELAACMEVPEQTALEYLDELARKGWAKPPQGGRYRINIGWPGIDDER